MTPPCGKPLHVALCAKMNEYILFSPSLKYQCISKMEEAHAEHKRLVNALEELDGSSKACASTLSGTERALKQAVDERDALANEATNLKQTVAMMETEVQRGHLEVAEGSTRLHKAHAELLARDRCIAQMHDQMEAATERCSALNQEVSVPAIWLGASAHYLVGWGRVPTIWLGALGIPLGKLADTFCEQSFVHIYMHLASII